MGRKIPCKFKLESACQTSGGKGTYETSIGYAKRFYLIYNEWFTIHPQVGGEYRTVIWYIPREHYKYQYHRQKIYLIYNKQLTIHPQVVGELQDSAIGVFLYTKL